MNYSVTGEQLTGIADAIREKTGGTDPLSFPDEFEEGISSLTDTSDADATEEYLHINKTAYVNGEKITGTGRIIRRKEITKTWPSTEKVVPAGGCFLISAVFQGSEMANVKGIDKITTTSSVDTGYGGFGYSQYISPSTGERRINMIFQNEHGSQKTIPANAFTSVATLIY